MRSLVSAWLCPAPLPQQRSRRSAECRAARCRSHRALRADRFEPSAAPEAHRVMAAGGSTSSTCRHTGRQRHTWGTLFRLLCCQYSASKPQTLHAPEPHQLLLDCVACIIALLGVVLHKFEVAPCIRSLHAPLHEPGAERRQIHYPHTRMPTHPPTPHPRAFVLFLHAFLLSAQSNVCEVEAGGMLETLKVVQKHHS